MKESFVRDLGGVKQKNLLARVSKVIELIKGAPHLRDLTSLDIKKLKGTGGRYRIRVGDYRIGFIEGEGVITFVRFLHRRDIYRYFS